jgi:GT2 family glycosyltransferase
VQLKKEIDGKLIVNIIIIGYNLPKLEKECIESILQNTKWPYVITYFNNYNSGITLTEIWNRLIEASSQELICLLNNDTLVHPGWLEKMVETITSNQNIGFVGPSTNECHGGYQQRYKTKENALKQSCKASFPTEPLVGFCLLLKKSIWEKLGKFDEMYKLYGQESDLLMRALKQGYRFAWRHDSWVFHYGEASAKAFKINIAMERHKAQILYKTKVTKQGLGSQNINRTQRCPRGSSIPFSRVRQNTDQFSRTRKPT